MSAKFVPATGLACFLKWYDPLVRLFAGETRFKAHLLSHVVTSLPARMLDVGCGSGTLALAIARQHPDIEIVGVDADPRILDQARRKMRAQQGAQVKWQLGDATQLSWPDESVDQVFCTLVFHHLRTTEKKLALAEFFRVLKPGGVLSLADFARPASQFARLRFITVRMIDGWQRTRCNDQGGLQQLMRQAGFDPVDETLALATLMGTIRCFCAIRPSPVARTTASGCDREPAAS